MVWSIKNEAELPYCLLLYISLVCILWWPAINAVLAIIADGGRAIVVIYREGVEINYFLLYFIDSAKTLCRWPRSTPCK